ncbi:hypothetical protein JA1_003879 [Spathaspora sp. JA1]|nr:hypothetical protein JA1_003879 [Spathaspora sp. JA1]
MAGTCISTIKVLGWGSLGLLTTSLTYQSAYQIPQFITKITRDVVDHTTSSTFQSQLKDVLCSIVGSRIVNITLGVLATGLFSIAYGYSPIDEKHPYLLYSSIGAPLAVVGLYFRVYKYETRILGNKNKQGKTKKKSETVAKVPTRTEEDEEEPEVISKTTSQDDPLGKSYVHLSEDSGTSTPTSISSPEIRSISPQPVPVSTINKPEVKEISIDEEIEQTLVKKEVVQDLNTIKSEYRLGVSISAVSLLIASIGIFGDFYLL